MTNQDYRIPLRRLALPHRPLPFSAAISRPSAVVPLPVREHTSRSMLVTTMDTKRTQWKWQEGDGKEYMIMPKLRLPAILPELAVGEAEQFAPVTMRYLTHMGVPRPPYSSQMASTRRKQTIISSSVLTIEFSLEVQGQKNSRQFLGKPDQLGKGQVIVKVMLVGAK